MLFSEIDIDWAALFDVIWISAVAGILIATVLGIGIVANLRSQEAQGGAIALHAVTALSVVIVGAAIVVGILFIINK